MIMRSRSDFFTAVLIISLLMLAMLFGDGRFW
jgi:hypothetical protein